MDIIMIAKSVLVKSAKNISLKNSHYTLRSSVSATAGPKFPNSIDMVMRGDLFVDMILEERIIQCLGVGAIRIQCMDVGGHDVVNRKNNDIKVIWMQEGIYNEEAEKRAKANGMDIVFNRCMMAEHRRLF